MKLLKDNVLVCESEKAEKTAGGVYLVDNANDNTVQPGTVVSYGPNTDLEIFRGAKVYFDWSKSMPVMYEGKRAAIVAASEIVAVDE